MEIPVDSTHSPCAPGARLTTKPPRVTPVSFTRAARESPRRRCKRAFTEKHRANAGAPSRIFSPA